MTRFQAAPVWSAYQAQRDLLRQWLLALPPVAWSRPSVLPAWTVLELALHVGVISSATASVVEGGASLQRPVSLGDYTGAWAGAADAIAEVAIEAARGLSAESAMAVWDDSDARAVRLQTALSDDLVVTAPRGPLRVGDFLATRVNELVVHAGDLSRSVPDVDPVPLDRKALAISCRMLTTVLADRYPGHTLEVRVPPYAAVQCVEGPRHTRGTPPNVVETDPSTWVMIAAGRLPYEDAVAQGLVKASGLRADLGPYLPLF